MTTRLCYHNTYCTYSKVKFDIVNSMSRHGFNGVKVIEREPINVEYSRVPMDNTSEVFYDINIFEEMKKEIKAKTQIRDKLKPELIMSITNTLQDLTIEINDLQNKLKEEIKDRETQFPSDLDYDQKSLEDVILCEAYFTPGDDEDKNYYNATKKVLSLLIK